AKRHEVRFPHGEINEADPNLPTISPAVVNEMDAATVWDALGLLDENYRAPLTLFYLEDHSYQEIAEALKIPVGTVMSRISRGKALLRGRLTQSDTARKIVPLDEKQLRKNSLP
ncbi:MAG: sigma factor-like helix-turn-helix DNA-binding protein, partial [Verrucomicrobiota bacterium]